VLVNCLGSAEWMDAHACGIEHGAFPEVGMVQTLVKDSPCCNLCSALAREAARADDGNALRPPMLIAFKMGEMLAHVRKMHSAKLSAKEAFQALDLDEFLQHRALKEQTTAEGEGGGGEDVAASSDVGMAETAETAAAGAERGESAQREAACSLEAAAASSEGLASADKNGCSGDGDDGGCDAGSSTDVDGGGANESSTVAEYDETYVPPVRNGRDITFQTRIVNPHLVCHLCMGYFKDACTIIECLHTFCRACVLRHFKDSNVCPTCDSHLGTNPRDLVRTDRTLQSIVDKIFPQFAQREKPLKRPTSPPPRGASPKQSRHVEPPPPESEPQEISFSLQEVGTPMGNIIGGRLEKPYLRTSTRLTVAHLKKYLTKKMRLKEDDTIEIFCRDVQLPLETTLERINSLHWCEPDEDLVLKYQVTSA